MNILQLCHRVPFPANDGGNIAMISMADGLLSCGNTLKMLTLNTQKHFVELQSLPQEIKSKYRLESVPIDTSVKVFDAFANLFSKDSYNVKRFYSPAFEVKMEEVLKATGADIILLESIFMAPYISAARKISKAKIVLRAHNVEYIIWERLAANEKKILKRKYLSLLASRLKRYEAQALSMVDAVIPITPGDESEFRKLGCRVPLQVAPVGLEPDRYPDQADEKKELCLFHLGAMDWRPNLEGIQWFLSECWQSIHQRFPALRLYLAGRGFPSSLMQRKDPHVNCEGEIKDAHEFMNGKQIMVVPLKSGGGMRVKIIQGLALGKTIISTTIGAEGINYTNAKNILIADTPAEILNALEECMTDKEFCFSVGKEARKFALENYSNAAVGKKVTGFLNTLQ